MSGMNYYYNDKKNPLGGAIQFAKQAVRTMKGHVRDNVCEVPTATCGPPGHPCETCMHLKGYMDPRQWAEKDLCLIAPKSLARPVQYKRYFNRGVAVPPYLPASKVTGQLKEVKMPEICSAEQITSQILQHQQRELDRKFRESDDDTTPYLVSHNVYIEHNGRFTKAPKHLLQLGDYTTRVCYLEDIGGPEFNTPLDLAIFLQKIFSYVAKVSVGMLAGVALIELSVLVVLMPTVDQDLTEFFRVYTNVASTFILFSSVLTIITVIALFDWLDLEHMNLQHVWDTYMHRTIWLVLLPFFLAFVLRLFNADIDDQLYLQASADNSFRIPAADDPDPNKNLDFREDLYKWKMRLVGSNACIIIGWCLLVITRNDDLFLLHLESMKKYEVNQGRKASVEVTNPHLYGCGPC